MQNDLSPIAPGTRVTVLAPDARWNYAGIVRRPRARQLPLPGPDWYIVEEVDAVERLGRRAAMCVHRSNMRVDLDGGPAIP